MKYVLFTTLCLSSLCTWSQSRDIAGVYENISKSGSPQYVLTLHPDGSFQFDSYAVRQVDGRVMQINRDIPPATIAGSGLSGRGYWSVNKNIIHFSIDRKRDISHHFTLNFGDTMAKYSSHKKSDAKLEFIRSGIFWIEEIEFVKRN